MKETKREDEERGIRYAEIAEHAIRTLQAELFNEKLNEGEALAVLSLIGISLRGAVERAKNTDKK